MKNRGEILEAIRGGLIVSCQALPDEPLYSAYIMSKMAYAAKEGGAVGIRCNTPEDIKEIKKMVDLPVIALYKKDYKDSSIYITPTEVEIDALMDAEPEIIAMDATNRKRPNSVKLDDFFGSIRRRYPNQLFMADCATYEEGIHAQKIGFDIVGTTLCGYTEDTKGTILPNIELMDHLASSLDIPVIAEGGIWELNDLQEIYRRGHVFSVVIGSAITRPREITRRYTNAIVAVRG